MKRRHLSWLLVCALGVGLAGAEGAEDDWLARVRSRLETMPTRARRVMLVFPLVEAGSENGEIGWGRGLIALQAMWVSSFAPDRLLDTWDFTADWRFADQQLFGAGRRVTPEKIEAVCAALDTQNYVTGTLEVGPDRYVARLVLHGEKGVQEIEHAGPKAELPRLPCLIAVDVVAYLRVPITARQQEHLRRAPLSSVELFDEVAGRFHASYYFGTHQPWFWQSVAERCRTPWTQFAYVQASFWAFTRESWKLYTESPPETQTTALDVMGANAFLAPLNTAGLLCLRLIEEDPYDPEPLLRLAARLMEMGEEELAWAVLDRCAAVYGDSHLGPLYSGLFLAPYAWDVRDGMWAANTMNRTPGVFRRWLVRARTDLEAALEKEPRCWPAASALMAVADSLDLGQKYCEDRFAEVIAACPTLMQAYQKMLDPNAPAEAQLAFGRRCAATELYHTRIPSLLIEAHAMVAVDLPRWGGWLPPQAEGKEMLTKYFSQPAVWQEVAPVLERLAEQNPLDYRDLSRYLALAYWRGDTELASRLVERIPRAAYEAITENPSWFCLPSGLHDEVSRLARAGFPALAAAVREGDAEAVQRLIAAGEPVNQATHDGWTPLHVAAERGHMGIARLLLKGGADANAATEDGSTPLHLAAKNGHVPVALMLLAGGADVNATGPDGRTPLLVALEAYENPFAQLLLKRGADPNAKDATGNPALYVAALHMDKDMIRALAAAGADMNAMDADDRPVLYRVCDWQELEVAEVLLDLGADPDAKTAGGFAPLYTAAYYGHMETARLLIARGASLEARHKRGFTALHTAASQGHPEMVKLLLAHGADANDNQTEGGDSPLNFAARYAHVDCAKLLLEAGADIHCRTHNLWQPLHNAAYHGHVETVRFLLDNGAQADSECMWGTPLHLAAMCGSKELILIFLERGVDVNAVDRNGRTPTGQALKEGHADIAELLREHGGVE